MEKTACNGHSENSFPMRKANEIAEVKQTAAAITKGLTMLQKATCFNNDNELPFYRKDIHDPESKTTQQT